MRYNWQQKDWPNFRYNLESLQDTLFAITKKIGFVSGKYSALSENTQSELLIEIMVEEAVKTSEIEGEYINRADVRSSLKRILGVEHKPVKVHDKRAEGIAELMNIVRETFKKPLTEEMLFEWNIMILSSSPNPNLSIGQWRAGEEPMQIVSGHNERWKVHFEAPPAKSVAKEMKQFIHWFNTFAQDKSEANQLAPIRSAISHLYFESIHPFEDGNGRIGRAIAEKALFQGFGSPLLLSLSATIEANKKEYYDALNKSSKSNEITAWIQYFLSLILNAQTNTENQINFIINKTKFFDKYHDKLNERQKKVIKRMLKEGTQGFEGGMSAKKYMIITDTSKATATRDLQELVELKAFIQSGSGRSVRYTLNL